MCEALIVGLQCLRSKGQEERRRQKHPELAQVGRGSPGYMNQTEDGPEDDRGLQEIREQETGRPLRDPFNNKGKGLSAGDQSPALGSGDWSPAERPFQQQRKTLQS